MQTIENTNTIVNNVKTSNVVNVTFEELDAILSNTKLIKKASTFASVIQITEPKVLKKCRNTKEAFNGQIDKVSYVGIYLNPEYENIVLNQLKKEGKEESEYKKGQNTMVIDFCENNNFFGGFTNKKGVFMGNVIQYFANNVNDYKVINTDEETEYKASKKNVFYYLNGKQTDKADMPNVLPLSSKPTNQGTDKPIIIRKLYTRNIAQLVLNGVVYHTPRIDEII